MLQNCYKSIKCYENVKSRNNSVTYIISRGTSRAEVHRQARAGRQGGRARAYACAYISWKLEAVSKLELEAGNGSWQSWELNLDVKHLI